MIFLNKNNSKKESMTNEEFVEAVKYILNHELLSLNDKNNSKENPLILVDKEARLNRYDVICSYIKELEAEKKLTFKNQSRSIIDTQKLRTELPDIAKAYTKTATSKVLKISQRVLKNV